MPLVCVFRLHTLWYASYICLLSECYSGILLENSIVDYALGKIKIYLLCKDLIVAFVTSCPSFVVCLLRFFIAVTLIFLLKNFYSLFCQVFAVKKIDSSLFEDRLAEDFTQIVSKISKLRHPNIAELVGYCSEQGQNMLVHEYYRNGSLHEFLHLSDDFSKPLTWNTRVMIALGTARAVE